MRILLLGELSGVHQELAPSLRALGHNVVVGHSRYAAPGFSSDIPFFRPAPGNGGRTSVLRDIASQLFNAPKLTGFDIVQIITPKFFNWKIQGPMMRYLRRNNGAMVVINTSCTSDYHRRVAELSASGTENPAVEQRLQPWNVRTGLNCLRDSRLTSIGWTPWPAQNLPMGLGSGGGAVATPARRPLGRDGHLDRHHLAWREHEGSHEHGARGRERVCRRPG